jgi:hypothetical protein
MWTSLLKPALKAGLPYAKTGITKGIKWGLGGLFAGANALWLGNEYNTARSPGGFLSGQPEANPENPDGDIMETPAKYLMGGPQRYEQERRDAMSVLTERERNYELLDNDNVSKSNELALHFLLGPENNFSPFQRRKMLSLLLFGDESRLSKAAMADIPKNLALGDPDSIA